MEDFMLEKELKKLRERFRKILNEEDYQELIRKVREKGWQSPENIHVEFAKDYVVIRKVKSDVSNLL
jgi:hypothetical protein